MKTTFRFFAFFPTTILAFQCNVTDRNPDNESGYFLSFKVDGDLVEYSGRDVGYVISSYLEEVDGYYFQLGGQKNGLSSDKNAFGFVFLQDGADLHIDHTYTFNYEKITGNQPAEIGSDNWREISLHHAAVYVDDQGVEFSAVPVPNQSIQVETEYSVRFTAIHTNALEGTFTARLHNYDLDSYISITDGRFRLSNTLGLNDN